MTVETIIAIAVVLTLFGIVVWAFANALETTVHGEPSPRAIARGRRRARIEFARTRGRRP